MRRVLKVLLVAGLALLAGCEEAQVPLNLAPAFYASAFDFDGAQRRYMVGSYRDGEIALLAENGRRLGVLRSGVPGKPVLKLEFDPITRRLWALYADAVEVLSVDGQAAAQRLRLPQHGGDYIDFSIADAASVFVLTRNGEVLHIDVERRIAVRLANVPPLTALSAMCNTGGMGVPERASALVYRRESAALLLAQDGALRRIDARSGRVDTIVLREPLEGVTQLLRGNAADEVIAVHAHRSALTRLVFDSTGVLRAQERTALRVEGPFSVAMRDNRLQILLGSLRHHPAFCGDARPNRAPRIVTAHTDAQPWHVAQRGAVSTRVE